MTKKVYDEPSAVSAAGGSVRVKGPDGVDVELTGDAAIETGGRLMDEGVRAVGQVREGKINQRPK